jgi:CAAX protease family protein
MEPESRSDADEHPETENSPIPAPLPRPGNHGVTADRPDGFDWFLIGPNGLRTGWLILVFAVSFYFLRQIVGTIVFSSGFIGENEFASAKVILLGEMAAFLALLGALAFMRLIEGRQILDYNLADRRPSQHFFVGLISGFVAISLLVAAMMWGKWLRFGAGALSGTQALRFAALWGSAFLLVGLVEEGLFRCYGLSTLTRGINFWWALSAQIAVCLFLPFDGGRNGIYGAYAAAGLGLIPCLVLHYRKGSQSSFWQAAWVTSTLFAVYHTANGGENGVGIFAAAAIGFIFCVSVRVTGSAWWAIGCHAGWDWGETFFYGTANSGMAAQGHYLSTTPVGNALWSGGTDGPEGSVLVLGAILLLLITLLVVYGRQSAQTIGAPEAPMAG